MKVQHIYKTGTDDHRGIMGPSHVTQSWTSVGSIHGSGWVGSWFFLYMVGRGPIVWVTLDDTEGHFIFP